jgi:putative ABC transport system permease protein
MFGLAIRELRFSFQKLKIVFLILIVGFVGPLFSAALKDSVGHYITARSTQILSADIALSSLREFKPGELSEIDTLVHPIQKAHETEFVTMARGASTSTLVQVKAVDIDFPLRGHFVFKDGPAKSSSKDSARNLSDAQVAWVFPEVLAQLGLKKGEQISLGQSKFTIAEVLTDGPGISGGPGSLAPRLYISQKFAAATGLMAYGSQVYRRLYLTLPKDLTFEKASARIKEKIPDPDIFLRTPDDATAGLEKFFEFFNQYLISISMIVFALSWASGLYVLQVFLQERLKTSAIMMTFGAQASEAVFLAFIQIAAILTVALLAATAAVAGLVSIAPWLSGGIFPEDFELKLRLADISRMGIVCLLTSVAFVIPFVVRIRRLKLNELLGESVMGIAQVSKLTNFISFAPLLLIFMGLAMWLMGSAKFGFYLMGGLMGAVLIGWGLARITFAFFFRVFKNREGLLRLIATNLSRSRFAMNLSFVAILLTTIVLNLVPHLLKSASEEVSPIQGADVPSLFLFNIPESAVDGLEKFAHENEAELRFLSPMILARLMKVNSVLTVNDGFLRFPVRLSYRQDLTSSEKLVEGQPMRGPAQAGEIPKISMEIKFAERNGFRIGDRLEFDIQGIPMQGQIANFRQVRWSDFHPNFFMIFQPGAIDDAPKTFLANVNLRGRDSGDFEARKIKFQFDLIKGFPDLNVVDIGRTLDRVLETVRNVLGPVRVAAWVAVFMSFIILGGVIAHGLRLRHPEVDIEKLLGADPGLIRRLMTAEYALSAFFASLLGAGFSLALTAIATRKIFDIAAKFDILAVVISVTVTVLLTTLLALQACRQVLHLRGTSRKM